MSAADGTLSADTVVDMPPITGAHPPIPDAIVHWRGEATGSWWAIVPGRCGYRMVEAPSAAALAVTVDWHLKTAAP